jgi:hypothetical protein
MPGKLAQAGARCCSASRWTIGQRNAVVSFGVGTSGWLALMCLPRPRSTTIPAG